MRLLNQMFIWAAVSSMIWAQPLPSNATVFASGLNNPRGLIFGPNYKLFVSEAGTGGESTTIGECSQQVGFPLGPLRGGLTGRVSQISRDGQRETVTDALPSTKTSNITGQDVFGVTAVEAEGNAVYVLVAAGCTKGLLGQPSALYRAEPNGNRSMIADLSAYYRANPPAVQDADHDPDGVPYAMVRKNGDFYILNANHGVLDRVQPNGAITRVADLTPVYGHITPTAIVAGPDGNFYIANVGHVPHLNGQSVLIRVTPDGAIDTVATGLTSVLGLAIDCQSRVYALETATGSTGTPPFFPAGTGRIVRYDNGNWTPVAVGLTRPNGMTFGPDGLLYVSHRAHGFGSVEGLGEVIRVDVGSGCR